MVGILLLSVFTTTMLFIYGLANLLPGKKDRKIERRLKSINYDQAKEELEKDASLMERAVIPLTNEMRKKVGSSISVVKKEQLEMKLLQAGNPFNLTPVDFRLIQLLLVFILPIALAAYMYILGLSLTQVFLVFILSVAFSLWYPQFYLQKKAQARRVKALKELPDFLDLLSVSMEAGLGFDSAVSKIVEKEQGILGEEFRRYLDEIRLGRTRRDALNGVKERVNLDDLSQCINGIMQADRMGIGMVNVLRIQTEELRDKRKQRAEEQAMKAPVKMMFPLVLFIFPSIFIVILAPAIIQFIDVMSAPK